jgi:UDP-N-acetylglucosamine transferase subunit ALG13
MTIGATEPKYQKLFDYMYKDHNVMLLTSDMDEIVGIVKEIIKENNLGTQKYSRAIISIFKFLDEMDELKIDYALVVKIKEIGSVISKPSFKKKAIKELIKCASD